MGLLHGPVHCGGRETALRRGRRPWPRGCLPPQPFHATNSMAPAGCQTMCRDKRDQISPFCKCGDQVADRHGHSGDETGGSWGTNPASLWGAGKGKSGSSSVGPGKGCHGRKVVWSEKAWARPGTKRLSWLGYREQRGEKRERLGRAGWRAC